MQLNGELPDGVRIAGKINVQRANLQLAWSSDGGVLAAPFDVDTVNMWGWPDLRVRRTFPDHTAAVLGVGWSSDSNYFASSTAIGSIRVWSGNFRAPARPIKAHTGAIYALRWHPIVPNVFASGSEDGSLGLITLDHEAHVERRNSHHHTVIDVRWSPDGKRLASAGLDGSVRIWSYPEFRQEDIVSLGSGPVSIDWSLDGKTISVGSQDATVRILNSQSLQVIQILEGHTAPVASVSFSHDGRMLASRGVNGDLRVWRTDHWDCICRLRARRQTLRPSGVAFNPRKTILAAVADDSTEIHLYDLDWDILTAAHNQDLGTVHYSNAKIVLVGDSGVGKTGLSLVLTKQPFAPTDSTHGRRVLVFGNDDVELPNSTKVIRESLIWDLAGQPGYRLVHQLSLGEAAVALVVFDAKSEIDPLAGVYHWDRALRQAERSQGGTVSDIQKFLVAARVDRGGIAVSPARIKKLVGDLGYSAYFQTSARDGQNVTELTAAIEAAIDWNRLPRVTSNHLFRRIKSFIVEQKTKGKLLLRVDDLYLDFTAHHEDVRDTNDLREQFEACLGLVDSRGLVRRLSFGGLVLLKPEYLDSYASAMVNAAREEPDGLGCLSEAIAKSGAFRVPCDERISDSEQEKLLILATIEELLRHEIALREDEATEPVLVFPSQFTIDWPEAPNPEGRWAKFEFEGAIMHIYATLAVRLAQSNNFHKTQIWRNAVLYRAKTGGFYGIWLKEIEDGKAELTLFCRDAEATTRLTFENFVGNHLHRRAVLQSVCRRQIYSCPECGVEITSSQIEARKRTGVNWIACNVCERRIPILEDDRLTEVASPTVIKMDRSADASRNRQVAVTILAGKRQTVDFDVFMCYPRQFQHEIVEIAEMLKVKGLLPWIDVEQLRPGVPWQRILEVQIKKIRSAAVFIGESGPGPWQTLEIEAFLRKFVERRAPIIPVYLADSSSRNRNSPSTRIRRLPAFLESFQYVDFRRSDPDPLNQLIWGITGKRT